MIIMINRKITPKLIEALKDSPVIVLHGARQTGKSTLIKSIVKNEHKAEYITFDDTAVLSAAKNNPGGFLESYDNNLAIDEVQRVPELFLAIKKIVDTNRRPGKFILTGSANILLIPKISESLAGRIEILNLYPFSQNELAASKFNLVDSFFDNKINLPKEFKSSNSILNRIVFGGYPEVQDRKSPARRDAWFNSYITTILQRDVRDLSNIDGITQLPRLLRLFAARSGSILNFAEVSRSSGMPQSTLKRYMTLLESTFMTYLLPPFSGNFSKRLIKTPKVYLYDTGLLTHLISADENRFKNDPSLLGSVVENFVLMEIIKQISWSEQLLNIYYFRTSSGQEVDFLIERNDGSLVGIEVKATQSPRAEMFKWLKLLATETGKKFVRGFMFYNGEKLIPFDKNLFAIPISAFWS